MPWDVREQLFLGLISVGTLQSTAPFGADSPCLIFMNFDERVKRLILLVPQAILGFMTRLAKLQELGRTPSNSVQFLTPDASRIFLQNCLMRLTKDFLRNLQF
jgi:hypothetical protein